MDRSTRASPGTAGRIDTAAVGGSGRQGLRGPGARGVAWVSYDFANTIFSVIILSYFFPLWVGKRVGGAGLLFAPSPVNAAKAPSS